MYKLFTHYKWRIKANGKWRITANGKWSVRAFKKLAYSLSNDFDQANICMTRSNYIERLILIDYIASFVSFICQIVCEWVRMVECAPLNTVINFDLSKFTLKSLFIIDRSFESIFGFSTPTIVVIQINLNIQTEVGTHFEYFIWFLHPIKTCMRTGNM